MMRCMNASEDCIRRAVARTDYGSKKRFVEVVRNGVIHGLAAAQGHSGEAHAMIDDEQHLTPVKHRNELPKVCLHGTAKEYVDSILEYGLVPGGLRGPQYQGPCPPS